MGASGRWIGGGAGMVVLTALAGGCGSSGALPARVAVTAPAPAPPAESDLGTHSRKVSTSNAAAQHAFDRGLVLSFAFNHGEAEAEFRKAAAADPSLAMAWWGVALVNGPHINNPSMSDDMVKTAWDALGRAKALVSHASTTEVELIDALSARYAQAPAADRGPLDAAYAKAMRALAAKHPDDADVLTLAAESVMDLHPWDLWTEKGEPKQDTNEILATLEKALAVDPQHPGANHLYVHSVEGSPHPERGLASADRLRNLVPGAGHLVHMPGHIYVRTGRWEDAREANVKAIAADAAFRDPHREPGFYRIYMAHNRQFLSFVDMMIGRSQEAVDSSRAMLAEIPDAFVTGPQASFVDGAMDMTTGVLMRFGRWDAVLAEPPPRGALPLSSALHLYARAAALSALDRRDEALKERDAFRAAAEKVPKDAFFGNSPASSLLSIASHVLDGEMAARAKHWDEAVSSLREAARVEDGLKYDDPPDWMQPVRHSLGAVLLGAGRAKDAEAVYREALVRFPEEGWSLFGLARALRLQGRDAEAADVEKRFHAVWAHADITIGASCLCQPPT